MGNGCGFRGFGFRLLTFTRQQIALERFGEQLFELFHTRQFVDVFETEAKQKLLAGLVEDGTADDGFSACGRDEFTIKQGGDDTARIDAANLADLRHGDRLLVGDDGQGFERGQRKTERRLQTFGEGPHHVVLLGLGGHAKSTRNLADLDAVT